jgi:hypothetical protein
MIRLKSNKIKFKCWIGYILNLLGESTRSLNKFNWIRRITKTRTNEFMNSRIHEKIQNPIRNSEISIHLFYE